MILTVVFVLVLLIGISLFIAVAGTALLRRNSRYLGSDGGREPAGRGYREEPRRFFDERSQGRAYEERARGYVHEERAQGRVEPREEAPPAYSPPYTPLEPRFYPSPASRPGGGDGKWFFITIVILAFIFFGVFFGLKTFQAATSKPRLIFCESVDLIELRPVNAADTFTRGNVIVFYKSSVPLERDLVKIAVYKRDIEGISPYTSRELSVKPDWTSLSSKIVFDQIGTYTVMIHDKTGNLLAQGSLRIVPDSFAYKPVWGY